MSEQKEQMVTLTFTVNELNLIFTAIQELPFRAVDPLIRNVQSQLQTQAEKQKSETNENESKS